MSQAKADQATHGQTSSGRWVGAGVFLLLVLIIGLSLFHLGAPAPVPADAPLTEFASGRAMRHLEAVTKSPHPIGSAQHAEVRDYLVRELRTLGLEAEVVTAFGFNQRWGLPYRAATVENVLGTLKGTGGGKSILLVCHYDSAPASHGANDDGVAVASMLETARALKAGAPLSHDLLFLFTDGEEAGLLGAEAFVNTGERLKDVALVLNFEARGSGGASMLFETSDGNAWLVREFAAAAPHPVANSLSYEVYRRMPNDTDLTVFKGVGLPGLNFAYFDGFNSYHTPLDTVAHVDERSLQHQGSYALALARHFGGLTFAPAVSGNAVYFNVFGSWLITYGEGWVMPLVLLVVVLFIAVVVLGFKRGHLTAKGTGLGAFVFLLALVIVPLLLYGVWMLLSGVRGWGGLLEQGETYRDDYYLLGLVILAVALAMSVYALFVRKTGIYNFAVGALLWWLLLTVALSVLAPGGSYLLTWPLFFTLVGLGLVFLRRGRESTPAFTDYLWLCLFAVPGLLLFVPVIHIVSTALTLNSVVVTVALVVWLGGLLVPHIGAMLGGRRWLAPLGLLAVAAVVLLTAGLTDRADPGHPRPETVFYSFDADTGKGSWVSGDEQPGEWGAQLLGASPQRQTLPAVFPLSPAQFWQGDAPAVALDAPQARVLEDVVTEKKVRRLKLRLESPRGAPVFAFYVNGRAPALGAALEENRINPGTSNHWGIRYYNMPREGLTLTLELPPDSPLALRVVDQTYGIAQPQGASAVARPPHVMHSAVPYADATFVSKTFNF
jgi:hypothetical protein